VITEHKKNVSVDCIGLLLRTGENRNDLIFFSIKLVLSDVAGSGDTEILRVGRRSTCDTLSRDPYIKSHCISTTMVLALEI